MERNGNHCRHYVIIWRTGFKLIFVNKRNVNGLLSMVNGKW
jgi:hypothetical protein